MNTMDFKDWKWLNESKADISEQEVAIHATGHTDWFCSPVPDSCGSLEPPVSSAPFFYTEVTGDFVFSAKVRPAHTDVFDAATLMVIENESLWAKLAFEATDFGTNAAVCVVTNGVSDDANGCDVEQDAVWLKIVRKGGVFSTHYSLNGETYHMVRLFRLPVPETVKVGFGAQSPLGEGGMRFFSNVQLEHKTVENLRAGE